MNLDKHRLMGMVRNSAQLAYDAARELEEYAIEHTNHLSSDDLAVIKNAHDVNKLAWRRLNTTAAIFRTEVESRRAVKQLFEVKV